VCWKKSKVKLPIWIVRRFTVLCGAGVQKMEICVPEKLVTVEGTVDPEVVLARIRSTGKAASLVD
jgi:hypothetical protein